MGIGYIGLEQSQNSYANLPVRLFNKGLIDIVGYSLWFKSGNSSTAKLIFGGVDTNRFYGALETVPISMEQLQYQLVTVELSGITVTTSNQTTNITDSPKTVILDSGTPSFVLGTKQLSKLGFQLGAVDDTSGGGYVKRYTELDNTTTIDFTFGGTNISVPVSDLVIPYNDMFAFLNILPSATTGIDIVGLPFFRNAYTVFDYSHNRLGAVSAFEGYGHGGRSVTESVMSYSSAASPSRRAEELLHLLTAGRHGTAAT